MSQACWLITVCPLEPIGLVTHVQVAMYEFAFWIREKKLSSPIGVSDSFTCSSGW